MTNSSSPPASVRQRYSLVAATFHWVLGLGIVAMFLFGLFMVQLPFSPDKIKYVNWHKWGGVVILGLMVLRLLWRLTHRPPPLPEKISSTMPGWQRLAHHGVHQAFYVLFFAVPLLGWAFSSAAGFPVVVFGLYPLPDLVLPNPELADKLQLAHRYAAYTLMALVVVHVAAVAKHHFVERNGLLSRMPPF